MNGYKNILVTGGNGFVGYNMINYMLEKYDHINLYNLDKLDYCANNGNAEAEKYNNYIFIHGDICDYEIVSMILIKYDIDIIVHFASHSYVDASFENPLQFTINNIQGTHTLLEACRKYGKIKSFLHMSTDEVYGESSGENDIKTEDSRLNPTNPYAATKAASECIINSYIYSYKIPIIIIRCNNIYGIHQYPEKLISKFITLLLHDKKCTIHGTGKMLRSFIHANDVCKAIDVIINKGVHGEIYNIGSVDEISVIDVTKILVGKIKPNENINDWIVHVENRCCNDQRYLVNCEKLKRLGWSQQIKFDDGIEEVISWYSDQIKHNKRKIINEINI